MFIFGGPDGETEWFIFGRDEAALQVTLSVRPSVIGLFLAFYTRCAFILRFSFFLIFGDLSCL